MCEPFMLAKTGLTVREHQARSVASLLQLRELAPSVPWAPVLQGWQVDDYLGHIDQYRAAGADLTAEPIVGVGSVCRRQGTRFAVDLFSALAARGIRPHGFGLKTLGLRRCAGWLASADSLAWSLAARRSEPLPGCPHKHCANCLRYALRWRSATLGAAGRPHQSQFAF